MFFATILILTIVIPFVFIQHKKGGDNTLLNFIAGVGFVYSWALVVMWLTVLIEGWQISLNTPMVRSELIPVWVRFVLNLLHSISFLFPVNRLTLGILYALPVLLIPLGFIGMGRWFIGWDNLSILLYSTMLNLLFFWIQVLADSGSHSSFVYVSVQGTVLLMTYLVLLVALIGQRPFSFTAPYKLSNTK